jgi:glutamate synthase domain-containing protein 2
MALGADAVAIGTAALIALGDNHPRYAMEYAALGSAAGFYDDFQDGRDPAGITTQHPELAARLVVDPRRDALIDVRVDVAAVADRRAEDVRGGSRP